MKKIGVSTEKGRCVSLPGDRGRFVMTMPNALTDSIDAWSPCQITVNRSFCSEMGWRGACATFRSV